MRTNFRRGKKYTAGAVMAELGMSPEQFRRYRERLPAPEQLPGGGAQYWLGETLIRVLRDGRMSELLSIRREMSAKGH